MLLGGAYNEIILRKQSDFSNFIPHIIQATPKGFIISLLKSCLHMYVLPLHARKLPQNIFWVCPRLSDIIAIQIS